LVDIDEEGDAMIWQDYFRIMPCHRAWTLFAMDIAAGRSFVDMLSAYPYFDDILWAARRAKHPELLAVLALYAPDYLIREAVALNPDTPREQLEILARDPNAYVRMSIARNINTPRHTLKQLVEDSNLVVSTLARNALSS
jgi:hypothetical protein